MSACEGSDKQNVTSGREVSGGGCVSSADMFGDFVVEISDFWTTCYAYSLCRRCRRCIKR
jgi:hypothetical protein